jgi:hypothetical protein
MFDSCFASILLSSLPFSVASPFLLTIYSHFTSFDEIFFRLLFFLRRLLMITFLVSSGSLGSVMALVSSSVVG